MLHSVKACCLLHQDQAWCDRYFPDLKEKSIRGKHAHLNVPFYWIFERICGSALAVSLW